MKIVSAAEMAAKSARVPAEPGQLLPDWIEGPHNGDQLDVGVVTMSPGGVTPPHVHVGGQVLVVTAGRGFVEADGQRCTIEAGDVVVCPPGEEHIHGALGDSPLAHLTITTRGYTFPEPSGSDVSGR